MLQSALAILAGFAVMVVVVILTTMLGARFLLGGLQALRQGETARALPVSYLVMNLIGSGVAALLGGYLAARIAGHAPLIHGAILAAVMILMSLASMKQAGSSQPKWYQLVLATVMPLLAVGGALLWHV